MPMKLPHLLFVQIIDLQATPIQPTAHVSDEPALVDQRRWRIALLEQMLREAVQIRSQRPFAGTLACRGRPCDGATMMCHGAPHPAVAITVVRIISKETQLQLFG